MPKTEKQRLKRKQKIKKLKKLKEYIKKHPIKTPILHQEQHKEQKGNKTQTKEHARLEDHII
jgi:hypothetical protein